MEELSRKKSEFLARYNPDRSIDTAISKSIAAAVQHNTLYAENVSLRERKNVRDFWAERLLSLNEKYATPQTVKSYEKDVLDLQTRMNDKYSNSFRSTPHPKYEYDSGFRISHSQKSISVYLKHLWCMGEIAEPPQCPVDAIILGLACRERSEWRWGYINSLEEHRRKIALLKSVADLKNQSIATWELLAFSE